MMTYLVRRLLLTIPVLLFVSMIVFALVNLVPGDPALIMLGEQATPEALTALRQEMGLHRPVAVRYLIWLGRVLRGVECEQPPELAFEIRLRGVEQSRGRHAAALVNASSKGWIDLRLSFSAAWLMTSRALTRVISSTATRWFALSVLPVPTRSTMASASPVNGASSIEP